MKDGERDKNYLLKQVRKEKCKEPEAIGRNGKNQHPRANVSQMWAVHVEWIDLRDWNKAGEGGLVRDRGREERREATGR